MISNSCPRLVISALVLFISISAIHTTTPAGQGATSELVVHEWGTFTSVPDIHGAATEWRPLTAPNDLPGFVYTTARAGGDGGVAPRQQTKRSIESTVRMETPVIYFYTGRETKISVKVGFPTGTITEWYPQAREA